MTDPIDNHVVEDIQSRLSAAEKEHDVKVIYACESGSRAWGFASPDSDYDVRFLYVRRSDWYLSFDVERRRDVIEYPIVDEIDISGWDIRKALHLFTRTNGALLEWLVSPIVYRDVGTFSSELRALASVAHNTIALQYHYSHMARGNAHDQFNDEQIKLKKYFYILRPLMAIRYIEQGHGLPPVEFQQLVNFAAPPEIKVAIEHLVQKKKLTPEVGVGARVPVLDTFITAELLRHSGSYSGDSRPSLKDKPSTSDELNAIFLSTIKNAFMH